MQFHVLCTCFHFLFRGFLYLTYVILCLLHVYIRPVFLHRNPITFALLSPSQLNSSHSKTFIPGKCSERCHCVDTYCSTLYSITGMIFIICYARSSNVQNIVLPILGQIMVRTLPVACVSPCLAVAYHHHSVQCIAPELIILRVARGRAWSSNTVTLLEGTTATSPKYIPQHSQLHSDTTDVEGAELGQVFPFYATEVSPNGPTSSDSGGESPLTRGKKSSLNFA